jgi:antitoxin MazE2
MTMVSFRVKDEEAAALARWAAALGVDRSELLRDAVHRHLATLSSENDIEAWQRQPLSDTERSLSSVADWGPDEDWSEWG